MRVEIEPFRIYGGMNTFKSTTSGAFNSREHNIMQNEILESWIAGGYGNAEIECKVVSNGYKNHCGYVDIALYAKAYNVGIEIDKLYPKERSIFKTKFFDVSVFIIRKRSIPEGFLSMDDIVQRSAVVISVFDYSMKHNLKVEYIELVRFFRDLMYYWNQKECQMQ